MRGDLSPQARPSLNHSRVLRITLSCDHKEMLRKEKSRVKQEGMRFKC